jgi:hypothetical protein
MIVIKYKKTVTITATHKLPSVKLRRFSKYNNYYKERHKEGCGQIKNQSFWRVYQSLVTKLGEKPIYRLAKELERKTRDLDRVKFLFATYLMKELIFYWILTG